MSTNAQAINQERAIPMWSWLLHAPDKEHQTPRFKEVLAETFRQASLALGLTGDAGAVPAEADTDGILPEILFEDAQCCITVCAGQQNNAFDPSIFEGAGELSGQSGHRPLLVMLLLQRRIGKELGIDGDDVLNICDPDCELLTFTGWDSLLPFIETFGFNAEATRRDAVALGLVVPAINFDAIGTADNDDYF